jgi:hypothetical protein
MCGMSRSDAARAKWAGVIREQRESGLSVARFCADRGIPSSSLFVWKRKLAGAEPAFVEAKVGRGEDERNSGAPTRSAERGRDECDGGVTIRLGRGRHVAVARGFDRRLLLEVIETLESGGEPIGGEAADGLPDGARP